MDEELRNHTREQYLNNEEMSELRFIKIIGKPFNPIKFKKL